MRILALLFALLTLAGHLLAAPDAVTDELQLRGGKVVEEKDEIYPLLLKQQKQIAGDYARGAVTVPKFGQWVEVNSAPARAVFPGLRFASITWNEEIDPQAKNKRDIGLAGGLRMSVAVDPKAGSVAAVMWGHGNYDEFGKLLVDRQVLLRDEADAARIWEAFCDIHFLQWKDYLHKRDVQDQWRLGIFSYDQTVSTTADTETIVKRTHYMRVTTDPATHRITGWKSVVETENERTVKKQPRR